eukprot:SAG31_NODE_706_length_12688_cov_41.991342_11_plen_37_part_00
MKQYRTVVPFLNIIKIVATKFSPVLDGTGTDAMKLN